MIKSYKTVPNKAYKIAVGMVCNKLAINGHD